MLVAELVKWRQTVIVALSKQMAYKLDFLLMLVVPPLVFAAVSYTVWRAVFELQETRSIEGFSMERMLAYQCWAFLVSLLIRAHRSWNLSEDIRMGRITSFLIYPFELWKFHASEFIAFQLIQLGIVTFSFLVLVGCGFISLPSIGVLVTGLLFTSSVGTLWFLSELIFGLTAFWLEESWVLRFIFNQMTLLLSGAFIPLELFPHSLRAILDYSPFPLLTSIPVQIFMGTSPHSLTFSCALLAFWLATLTILARFVWRRGIVLYSASGM